MKQRAIIHLRKERIRAYETWCGRWSHGTISPHLDKVSCEQCRRAFLFIGPIHPKAGVYRWRDTDPNYGLSKPWEAKPHWVVLREHEDREASKWERENKNKRRRIIDVSVTAALATGCNPTMGMV